MSYDIIYFISGLIFAYGFIYWRYQKEMEIRIGWMNKKLKNGKWKFPVALFIVLNVSSMIVNMIFSIVPNDFFLKPFFISFCFIPFFVLFLFKFFYEIIGGKREWKL